jgi:tRNA(His) 5'-end guanylyltransferase
MACNRKCGWLALTGNGALQGTTTGGKNEILWQHGINYQSLPEQFKKVSF